MYSEASKIKLTQEFYVYSEASKSGFSKKLLRLKIKLTQDFYVYSETSKSGFSKNDWN